MTDGVVLPTIVQAINGVMRAIDHVGKNEGGGKLGYKFRGIDAVINATGPAFRAHGVFVVPEVLNYEYATVKSNADKDLASVRLTVRYIFHGPAGDSISSTVVGEAFDSGDKATAKAMSVALRTCLLQVLALPTDDPDPDSQVYERGNSRAQGGVRIDREDWLDRIISAVALPTAQAQQAALAALWKEANGDPRLLEPLSVEIEAWKVRNAPATEAEAPQAEASTAHAAPPQPTEAEDTERVEGEFLTDLDQCVEARDVAGVRALMKRAADLGRPDLRKIAQAALDDLRGQGGKR